MNYYQSEGNKQKNDHRRTSSSIFKIEPQNKDRNVRNRAKEQNVNSAFPKHKNIPPRPVFSPFSKLIHLFCFSFLVLGSQILSITHDKF